MPLLDLTLKSELEELTEKSAGILLILDFYATWCSSCAKVMPGFLQMTKEFPNVTFLKIDVDEADDLCEDYQIAATPTFIFMKDSQVLDSYNGTDEDRIRSLIQMYK